jgi:la-related protein 1
VKPSATANTPAAEVSAPAAAKGQRRTGDNARNGTRGTRSADKESKEDRSEAPPSVEDAIAWPTPETAVKQETKKVAEKPERLEKDPQDDASQAKTRSKDKWVTYDYVPSVSFETQLPQLRGSRPRGGARTTNGTRPSGATQNGEKTPQPATTTSRPTEAREPRPRETTQVVNGAPPAPPPSKRAPADTAAPREQRKPPVSAAAEQPGKETHGNAHTKPPRERPEGRSERGRGGYRGRGGHHGMNPHSQHQHAVAAMAQSGYQGSGSLPLRPQGPYSPPPRQNNHGQMYMPPSTRGRGNRNGAGTNYNRMSLPNGRVPPVQTQFSSYEYPMAPMSAIPYQAPPYWEHAAVLPVLKQQVEYYFSIENLCKDMYLRSHMDSQGFVPLHFVGAFKRVRNLSPDLNLVRIACDESVELDVVIADDNTERLRRRENWERWVLPYSERDELARNDGPKQFSYRGSRFDYGHQFNGMPAAAYGLASPPAYPPYVEQHFQPYVEEHHHGFRPNGVATNGHDNGPSGSQLSANVPDFSPSGSLMFGGAKGFVPGADVSAGADMSQTHPADALNGVKEAQTAGGMPNGVHHAQDAGES